VAVAGLGTLAVAAILIAAAGAVGAAIFFGRNREIEIGPPTTVISPAR
jgi:hypothetical protein